MIAVLVDDINALKLIVEGEAFRHLKSSLRVQLNEEVLALDGLGKSSICKIEKISKKALILAPSRVESHDRLNNIDLLLCPPKREALNSCLRSSCELGLRNLYLYMSERTQNKKIDHNKSDRILKSSLVQSNNYFTPRLSSINELKDIRETYTDIFVFHPSGRFEVGDNVIFNKLKSYLMIIGPEGGLSDKDISNFSNHFKNTNLHFVGFETPLLRTNTALCVAAGWVLSKMDI